ncbi:MAG: ABC transporter permease [Acidobacteriota bacterium]|nr:ABC transporter permease [Acidobacteriota bacterium]
MNTEPLVSRESFPVAPSRRPLLRFLPRRLFALRSAQIGIAIAVCLCGASIAGQLVWRAAPEKMNQAQKLAPPSASHPLGTDQFGRDQLARMLDGGRRSLGAAVIVLVGMLLISLTVGVSAGMIGGWFETVVMRAIDVLLALPALVLALAVIGVLGVGYENLLLALTASSWAYYARLARSYVRLAVRRQDVIAARLAGIGWLRITVGHIVPGVITQLAIVATLDLGGIIIGIAGLSFLGLGVQPPDAEWGAMLAESRLYFAVAPWLLVAPAAAIFLTVIAANLIGNALRDLAEVK